TAELKEALDLHRKRLTEIYQKELEIENIIQAQQLALQTGQMTYQEISRKKDSVNYIVTALVESKGTQNVNFQLLYNVKDAGWYSTYDVRVTEVTDPLEILMNANVFQRSGETWKNISLILSTGNPSDNATPPTLQPWMLGYYDPNALSQNQNTNGVITGRVTNKNGEPIIFASVGIRGMNIGASTDANGYFKISNPANNELVISAVGYVQKVINSKPGYISIVLEESSATLSEVVVTSAGLTGKAAGVQISKEKRSEKDEKIQQVTVTTEYQPTTTVYQIKDKYTIETDGKTTTIGIKQMDIPTLYEYFTIPKIDPSAFLNAKITNWQDYDLQSGEASLYFEGTYLGKTYLDLSDATDTLTVSLGKDNGIKISRKPVKEFTAKKWIGSNQTDTRTFDISIRNNKKIPVSITVTDQFPVSTNKEISVDDMKADGANVDKETGIITWTITLQPGEEKIVTKSYSVKYPKGRKVILE
ncbi:MAG: mucoidy inhibitor MuiA family protein, partial [Bacteroidota bacterium]